MDAQELLAQARDAMTARRVFGEPLEKDGTTILPVASVMGGAGGGSGRTAGAAPRGATGAAGDTATEAGESAPTDEGSGYGFGMMAKPLGVYVIRSEEVTWQPAVDRNRQLMLGAIVSILAILATRSVLVTIARR